MHLQAGEWSLEFRDGDLWHIRAAGVEAVERVYFALRDEQWGTVPFKVSGLKIEPSGGGFTIAFDADHASGGIGFRWRGEIEGRGEGVIRYRAAGEALTTFKRNRIGLCVHHPLACAGREISVMHADTKKALASFPKLISPHQPVLGIRSMRYELGPGRAAEIGFEGEIWEMEDQRNWSDANFKTYPTPLALPYPVEVKAGTKFEQAVEIRLRYEGAKRTLLLGLALDETAPEPRNVERVHRLRVTHLRLERAERLKEAARWNLPVELALELGDEPEKQLAAVEAGAAPLARVIVYKKGEPVAAATWIALVRSKFPNVPVMPGSNVHFAELNRNRVSDFSQGVAFGLHPQVHASDDESIMANLASHDSMVETVRSFAGAGAVVASPVRFGWPSVADARLRTGLGAAWTRGAMANFARLGVESATFHTVGEVLESPGLERLFAGGVAE